VTPPKKDFCAFGTSDASELTDAEWSEGIFWLLDLFTGLDFKKKRIWGSQKQK